MKIDPKEFRVTGEKPIKLKKWKTVSKPFYENEQDYKKSLAGYVEELSELQKLLYASNQCSVLLIFQAMDAAGKDGAISHILSGVNPQGCDVHSFKQPSAEELEHDFLWRCIPRLPERGRIGVFNRSYYEEVLVVRVHPALLQPQGISEAKAQDDKFWEQRYESIADLEKHLSLNGTVVLKFFLHLSKEEQRKRLLARIDEPSKNWKFSGGDLLERDLWDNYMEAYEDCINATSSKAAPWHVIPADDKLNARLIIARTVVQAMKKLEMSYPELTREKEKELQSFRSKLQK